MKKLLLIACLGAAMSGLGWAGGGGPTETAPTMQTRAVVVGGNLWIDFITTWLALVL
jgi:hypothetical protein